MAADLSSMFAQLNNTIAANPLAKVQDATVPGMVARPQDTINPLMSGAMRGLTGAFGGNAEPMQTSREAYAQVMQAMQGLDLKTSQGLAQAAKLYQSIGMMPQAMELANRAAELREKQVAQLDAGGLEVRAEAKRKADMARVGKMAADAGDLEAAVGIRRGLIDPKEWLAAQTNLGTKGLHIGSTSRTVRDSEGNLFTVVPVTDKKTGKPKNEYAPIGDGPARPVGTVTPISNTTGYSGADTQRDRLDLANYKSMLKMDEASFQSELDRGDFTFEQKERLNAARQEAWDEERAAIVQTMPDMIMQQQGVEDALALLDTTTTSGITSSIEKAKDFLGLGNTASHAELNRAMSQYVLENLRALGSNPTEGERAFLIDAAANIGRGTEANVALFESTLKRLNKNIEATQYLLDNPTATRDEYIKNYNQIITGKADRPTVKFGDLK